MLTLQTEEAMSKLSYIKHIITKLKTEEDVQIISIPSYTYRDVEYNFVVINGYGVPLKCIVRLNNYQIEMLISDARDFL